MHRDVKPSNLLLASNGCIKLADFGLARAMMPATDNPRYTHAVATRWYRAPELLYGAREYGNAVDMWAVGMVLAEVLGMVIHPGLPAGRAGFTCNPCCSTASMVSIHTLPRLIGHRQQLVVVGQCVIVQGM